MHHTKLSSPLLPFVLLCLLIHFAADNNGRVASCSHTDRAHTHTIHSRQLNGSPLGAEEARLDRKPQSTFNIHDLLQKFTTSEKCTEMCCWRVKEVNNQYQCAASVRTAFNFKYSIRWLSKALSKPSQGTLHSRTLGPSSSRKC